MNSEHPLVSTSGHFRIITRNEPTMDVHIIPDGVMLTNE